MASSPFPFTLSKKISTFFFAGLNYYRIKQLDRDGSTAFSSVKTVKVINEDKPVIYPNPATSTFYVDFRGEDHFGTLVTLLDEQGKEHAIEHIWMTENLLWLRPVNCPMGLNWVKTTNSQGLIDIYPIVIEP